VLSDRSSRLRALTAILPRHQLPQNTLCPITSLYSLVESSRRGYRCELLLANSRNVRLCSTCKLSLLYDCRSARGTSRATTLIRLQIASFIPEDCRRPGASLGPHKTRGSRHFHGSNDATAVDCRRLILSDKTTTAVQLVVRQESVLRSAGFLCLLHSSEQRLHSSTDRHHLPTFKSLLPATRDVTSARTPLIRFAVDYFVVQLV